VRDKLIEVMARAMDPAAWAEHRMGWQEWNQRRATSINNATAALAAIEAEGCRVVPVEPSEAMLDAGDYVWDGGSYLVWQTMLAAALGGKP
jgi:hypothetical protein